MAHLAQHDAATGPAPRERASRIRSTDYIVERSTILIVDDERGPRESLRMILSPAHKVLAAESGAEALEILATSHVDLITVDLNMPGMKGEELMAKVREDHPHVEVIVITGNGSVQTAVEGLRVGIGDYLSKPFDVVQVSSAVARALGRQRSRRRLISFLEGIGTLLGEDRDARELLTDLQDSVEVRSRLESLLARSTDAGAAPTASAPFEQGAELLAQTLQSHDPELRGHARRVAGYADRLARQLNVDDELREQIRIASLLHDLGHVGAGERNEQPGNSADHAEIGERLVRPLGFSGQIASAIRHHHEHFDGTGAPDGLGGTELPLVARILAVADCYDELTSEHGESEPVAPEAAVAALEEQAGSRLDPALVRTFAALVADGTLPPSLHDLATAEASGGTGDSA